MDKGITGRIERIEQEIWNFISSWVDWSLTDLGFKGEKEPFHKILEPGADLLKRGGKRWRPLLMVLFSEIIGGGEEVYPFCPIVEIAHNGTLIVDDIEDNSEMRRGDKAVHLKFGTDMAINSGNFMCFLPALIIERSDLDVRKKGILSQYFLEDLRNLHIGQGLDIQWHRSYGFFPSEKEYFLMSRLKTGALSRMAARMGIILGGGDNKTARFVGDECEKFGIGFQIIDDIKNLTTGNPGKNPGDDIVEGKKSLPVILFALKEPEKKKRLVEVFTSLSDKGIRFDQEKVQDMVKESIDLISCSGAIKEAKQKAMDMISEARGNLEELFPGSSPLSLLFQVFDKLS